MYDAKKEQMKKDDKLRYECIATRSYFEKSSNSSLINAKISYIPTDNIFY